MTLAYYSLQLSQTGKNRLERFLFLTDTITPDRISETNLELTKN